MMLLAQAAQHSTPSPGFTFNPTISLGDIAQALALPLSLLVAWLTIYFSAREQRRAIEKTMSEQRTLAFIQDLLSRLTELLRDSNLLAKAVRKNLTKPDSKWKQCQITAEAMRKDLELNMEIISAFLEKADTDKMTLAYNKWYDSIFCDVWPCKPNGGISAGDTRLKAFEEGHLEWSQFVLKMKRDILGRWK